MEFTFDTDLAVSKRVASVNNSAKHLHAVKRNLSMFVGLR